MLRSSRLFIMQLVAVSPNGMHSLQQSANQHYGLPPLLLYLHCLGVCCIVCYSLSLTASFASLAADASQVGFFPVTLRS
jgi:hypothetical protein